MGSPGAHRRRASWAAALAGRGYRRWALRRRVGDAARIAEIARREVRRSRYCLVVTGGLLDAGRHAARPLSGTVRLGDLARATDPADPTDRADPTHRTEIPSPPDREDPPR